MEYFEVANCTLKTPEDEVITFLRSQIATTKDLAQKGRPFCAIPYMKGDPGFWRYVRVKQFMMVMARKSLVPFASEKANRSQICDQFHANYHFFFSKTFFLQEKVLSLHYRT